jgi:hypothetical protein
VIPAGDLSAALDALAFAQLVAIHFDQV